MRYARRAEGEPARRQIHARVADVEREIPLEYVEPLVFIGVDVPRGPEPGRNEELDEAVPSSRVRTANLHCLEHAGKPECLAFVVPQRITKRRSICSRRGHHRLL